jgi:hypothetical protein
MNHTTQSSKESAMTLKTISTLSLVALLALSTSANAQDAGQLQLSMTPSVGVPGVWALVSAGDQVVVSVSQEQLLKKKQGTVYLIASATKVKGELDAETLQLIAKGDVPAGEGFDIKLRIPDTSDTIYSLQALAVYEDGTYALSPVLTVLVDTSAADPIDPLTDPLTDPLESEEDLDPAANKNTNNETDPAATQDM